tara:strand:- start:81 stop:269 length:189 start_codon:yes stop_codon:yes gene_type:complete
VGTPNDDDCADVLQLTAAGSHRRRADRPVVGNVCVDEDLIGCVVKPVQEGQHTALKLVQVTE